MRRLKKVNKKKLLALTGGYLIFIFLFSLIFIYFNFIKYFIVVNALNYVSVDNKLLSDLIIDECADKGKKKTNCYDARLTEVASKVAMQSAFDITKKIGEKDKDYSYCHVVAHKIASEEVKKDPNSWRNIITQCPVNQCANGCIHGVFQERFKAESLSSSQIDLIKSEFTTVCTSTSTWNQTYYAKSSCYHALGHLFVYMSNADINKSLSLCSEITLENPDMTRYCYEGAFMQVFQVLEPEDEALVKKIKPRSQNEAAAFCANYKADGLMHAACVNQTWPYYIHKLRQDPKFLIELCSVAEERFKPLCEGPIISIMPIQLQFDCQKLINYCSALPQDNQQKCFEIIANRMITSDELLQKKAVNFCSKIPSQYADGCYISLIMVLKEDKVLTIENRQNICKHFPKDFLYSCLY